MTTCVWIDGPSAHLKSKKRTILHKHHFQCPFGLNLPSFCAVNEHINLYTYNNPSQCIMENSRNRNMRSRISQRTRFASRY